MRRLHPLVLLAVLAGAPHLGACASAPAAFALPDAPLPGSDGSAHRIADLARGASFTVVTFFSADCPCQRAHDARLREMADRYRARGVAFVAVDAEATATPAGDAEEARRRGYPFPLLTDPRGAAADALGATYATYSVVLDASLRVRYRGAVDSDRIHLRDDADPYLGDALDRLLAGREPARGATEALGCALRR
jgi:peroxiredoxin